MIGVVVVTHGRLAEALLEATTSIVGELRGMAAVSIAPGEGMDSIRGRLVEAIRGVEQGQGVLVLTDMFGGTPANLSLALMASHAIEVVTGVNLPMLVKLAAARNGEVVLGELAQRIQQYGQTNISVASELLQRRRGAETSAASPPPPKSADSKP